MIQKGYMRPAKKIMGIVIGIAGLGMVLGNDIINSFILKNNLAFGILLLIIAYFLVISGRQL